MKRIINILATIALSSVMVSCENFLDVPSKTTWGSGSFPTNESQLEGILNGGYDCLQTVLGSDFIKYGEARSDNYIIHKFSDTWNQILTNGLHYSISGSSWYNFYRVIKQANIVLDNIDAIKAGNGVENYSSLKGQALTMRAFSYFWIVRIWGDAPLVTKAYTSGHLIENLGRNPSSEILALIKQDLDAAIGLLGSNKYERMTFSYAAAQAIRAQVAAWEGDWNAVINAANPVLGGSKISLATPINNSNYKLASLYSTEYDPTSGDFVLNVVPTLEYVQMFNGSNASESIFEIAYIYANNENNDSLFGVLSNTNYPLMPSDVAYNRFSVQDWRYYANFYDQGGLKALKHLVGYVKNSSAHSIVLLRVSETALLKAEALINLNDTETDSEIRNSNYEMAMAIINTLRERAGGPTMKYDVEAYRSAGQDELKALVYDERFLELYCEGHRYFDLYRTGKLIEVMQPINGQNNLSSFYWPVNIDEIRRSNGLIEQNEYYK